MRVFNPLDGLEKTGNLIPNNHLRFNDSAAESIISLCDFDTHPDFFSVFEQS